MDFKTGAKTLADEVLTESNLGNNIYKIIKRKSGNNIGKGGHLVGFAKSWNRLLRQAVVVGICAGISKPLYCRKNTPYTWVNESGNKRRLFIPSCHKHSVVSTNSMVRRRNIKDSVKSTFAMAFCIKFIASQVRGHLKSHSVIVWWHQPITKKPTIRDLSVCLQTSYCKISWSLEVARFGFRLFQFDRPLGSSAALPRGLSNFRAVR